MTKQPRMWGEPERAPHLSYRAAQSFVYIYLSIYMYVRMSLSMHGISVDLVTRVTPVNTQHANVRSAA